MRAVYLLFLLLGLPLFCAAQTTWYVPDDYATIQEGIHGAVNGDTVIVRPGTYFENLDFAGKTITLVSESGPEVTVIDGNDSGSVILFNSGETRDSVLEGFAIINGSGKVTGMIALGGGLNCSYTSPTVTGCIIAGNRADFGGGIYHVGRQMKITDTTLIYNTAGIGGGMQNDGASPKVIRCAFIHNTGSSSGGGMGNRFASHAQLTNCVFSANHAPLGGGIYNNGSDAVLECCTFYGNQATTDGGGIYSEVNCSVPLTNCIFWNNPPGEIVELGFVSPVEHCCVMYGYPGDGNISEDPLFVDPANHDFHLTRYSPCINRGKELLTSPGDWDLDPRPIMGSVDMGIDEFSDTHTLASSAFQISQAQGGNILLPLQAGAAHAGRWYCLFGTISGTAPGTPLPGGGGMLPINFDHFTTIVLNQLNTPTFAQFMGILDGTGSGLANLNVSAGQIPSSWVGKKMHLAYTLDSFAMASNPVEVAILP